VAGPEYRLTLVDRPGYLHASISGEKDSFETTMGAVTELASLCQLRQVKKLLVEHDIAGQLSTLDVYKIASQLPELYRGIHVAFVIHHATIPDNPEFLRTVAQNRGATGRLFEDALQAEAWLVSL
jgi:hypothetical protein